MPIATSRHDRTFVITLNRPGAMNSIDAEMFDQITDAWDEFEHDDGLFVAVVTGAGDKAFCAGRDLVKSAADRGNDWSQRRNEGRLTPEGIWKPIIAAINGHCLAAGLGWRWAATCAWQARTRPSAPWRQSAESSPAVGRSSGWRATSRSAWRWR